MRFNLRMKTETIEIKWSWNHPVIQDILLKYYREWLFNTPENAKRMVERVLSISKLTPPGQVLDIGCGLGYHAAVFAKRGFKVLAFDPGGKYVNIARENVACFKNHIDIRQIKCCQLTESKRFSLAWAGGYCPGQLSPEEVAQDFRRIYKSLLPGGWFVSSVAGKPKVQPFKKVRNWKELSDCFILSEKWADETYFHENCQFVYPDQNKIVKLIEVERMYGVKEIVPMLEQTGFRSISTSCSLVDNKAPAQEGSHFAFWCRR